jgi:hypothetical protein
MQHLLDFVHEHTLEEQLFLVVETSSGELELLWQRRHDSNSWQLRPYKSEAAYENVARAELLDTLRGKGAVMERVERELRAIAMTQIAFADMLLRDANTALGRDFVNDALRGHEAFMTQLTSSITELVLKPAKAKAKAKAKMQVLAGGGASSETRSGHLRRI